jgi:hypothetical protein
VTMGWSEGLKHPLACVNRMSMHRGLHRRRSGVLAVACWRPFAGCCCPCVHVFPHIFTKQCGQPDVYLQSWTKPNGPLTQPEPPNSHLPGYQPP